MHSPRDLGRRGVVRDCRLGLLSSAAPAPALADTPLACKCWQLPRTAPFTHAAAALPFTPRPHLCQTGRRATAVLRCVTRRRRVCCRLR